MWLARLASCKALCKLDREQQSGSSCPRCGTEKPTVTSPIFITKNSRGQGSPVTGSQCSGNSEPQYPCFCQLQSLGKFSIPLSLVTLTVWGPRLRQAVIPAHCRLR